MLAVLLSVELQQSREVSIYGVGIVAQSNENINITFDIRNSIYASEIKIDVFIYSF